MLNAMLDTYDCVHYYKNVPDNIDGAVVVVHGETCCKMVEQLDHDLSKLTWVVLIVLGDETHQFPIEKMKHKNMKLWVQEPIPGKHNFADRFILDGWTHKSKKVECVRDMDWVFAGQDTHQRRKACVDALRSMDWGGILVLSKGFTQGVSLPEYFHLFSRAKFIPCPSGPSSPDAARPWEALECGAIPILDAYSPAQPQLGFWDLVLGKHPFIVVQDWAGIPKILRDRLPSWDSYSKECLSWWDAYKADWLTWLGKDIAWLTSRC
jgi:hypothetical protein